MYEFWCKLVLIFWTCKHDDHRFYYRRNFTDANIHEIDVIFSSSIQIFLLLKIKLTYFNCLTLFSKKYYTFSSFRISKPSRLSCTFLKVKKQSLQQTKSVTFYLMPCSIWLLFIYMCVCGVRAGALYYENRDKKIERFLCSELNTY